MPLAELFRQMSLYLCFFFNDTATTEIYTLSLHDALPIFVCTALAGLILFTLWFLGARAYHFTDLQMAEFFVYCLLGIGVPGIAIWVLVKRREWKENQRRYPPLVMSPAADAKHVEKAWKQNAVVLG